jgi:iron(III) transport system substrate-binding protein
MNRTKVIKLTSILFISLVIGAILLAIFLPGWDMLKQSEAKSRVLKIYSPLNERIIIPIIKEFQESTGIEVEYMSAGTLDLLNVLEGKGDGYLMDIMWGGGREYLRIYKELFEPLYPDGEYTLGFNQLPIVLIYNKRLVSEEELSGSWSDILDPQWKGRLAMADPEGSGSAYIALSFLLEWNRGEDYNWENAAKLLHNVGDVMLAKSSDVYKGVVAGDFAIGITMEEAAINLINQNENIGIVYFKEGTPVINDSIALMRDAENTEDAKRFIEFVLSRKVQSYMVERFYLRSVREDVKVPKGLSPMEELIIFDTSNLTTFDKREQILSLWQTIGSHSGIGD